MIVDECHHLSAQSFEQVARRAKAKFVTGLSATVTRKDGHHPIIFMQCGPVRHRVDARARPPPAFQHTVIVRPTEFRAPGLGPQTNASSFRRSTRNWPMTRRRNHTICEEVVEAVHEGRSPLVLTERTSISIGSRADSVGPASRRRFAGG